MKLRHSRIKIPPLPWIESEPIIEFSTQQFRAGTPAISARVVYVCLQFLPISIATIELLLRYYRHCRPHHHYLTLLPPIKDSKEMK